MRIGLNLLHARPDIGGGWNYISNIVGVLTLMDCDYEFIAYCTSISATIVPDDPRFTVKIIHLGSSSQVARVCYEQLVLPFLAYSDNVDCIHWFANNRSLLSFVPSVVTFYDFKFIDMPGDLSLAKKLYLRAMARFACNRAETLVPMSEATAACAIRLFGVERQRIITVQHPVDDAFCRVAADEVEAFRARLKLPSHFWLYVAHPYPHKNHERLVVAYKKFRETSERAWPLVLRGDRANGSEVLDRLAVELGINDSVIWLPRLSPRDMARLYSAATALIFPSLYEGCGIPVLEAMSCGCPVMASDISATQEFAGDAALMFDAKSVAAIVDAMHRFVEDPELRESCVARGLVKVEQYSARKIAGRLLAAYQHTFVEGGY